MAATLWLADLSPGCEVDYNAVGAFWVIARVEIIEESSLVLRFACGFHDISHRIDANAAVAAKRVCAAGMRSVPLLHRQPMDVLRRTAASASLGPSEQWQQGEVVTSTGKHTSYGGDKSVAVKVVSAGDAVLGVTYPHPTPSTAASPPPVDGQTHHAHPPPLQGQGQHGTPGKSVAAPSPYGPVLPPGAGSAATFLLADPSLLAPGCSMAQRVPTSAHITPAEQGAPPPSLRMLQARAKALMAGSAALTARYLATGRTGLADFDLVDILLPPPTHSQGCMGETIGGTCGHTHPHSTETLEEALTALHGPGLGHVGASPLVHAHAHVRHSHAHTHSVRLNASRAHALYGEPCPDLPPLPARVEARPWRLGRVLHEHETGMGGSADVGHTGGGPAGDVGGRKEAGSDRSPSGHRSGGGGRDVSRTLVYWFEPVYVAEDGGGGSGAGARVLCPVLRVAPVDDMLAIAPPGTHTVPYVPGQRVESRRLGGLWAPSRVLWADRMVVYVTCVRPGRKLDSNAGAPSAVCVFGRGAKPLSVRWRTRTKEVGDGNTVDVSVSSPGRRVKGQSASARGAKDSAKRDCRRGSLMPFPLPRHQGEASAPRHTPAPSPLALALPSHSLAPHPRTGPGPGSAVEAAEAVEAVPQQMWAHLLTSRPGHFCSPEAWRLFDKREGEGEGWRRAVAAQLGSGASVAAVAAEWDRGSAYAGFTR